MKSSEIQAFYDSFGKKQDAQSFYEDSALDELIAHAHFSEVGKVFEFGCGTGRFADRLLAEHLSSSATYLGCDLSSTMVELAKERLATYAERAQVLQSDDKMIFSLPDNSVDRVVSTYVLDLLSEMDIEAFLRETHRTLNKEGKLCLVSLTRGTTFLSRTVSAIWDGIFHLRPSLVGGCRPIHLKEYVDNKYWELEYQNVVIAFGVPSEILIVRPIHTN